MSVDHFDKVVSMVDEDCGSVTIGGGEPTLHKHCLDFVWRMIRASFPASYSAGMPTIGIVTNGSVEKTAIELAQMAEQGFISARLSYDRFHAIEKVSDRVKRAFTINPNRTKENDFRAINSFDYSVTPHGRAVRNGLANHPFQKADSCCCHGLFVVPNGTIYQCGCRQKVLGHLDNLSAFWDAYHVAFDNDTCELPCSKTIVDKVVDDDKQIELEYA